MLVEVPFPKVGQKVRLVESYEFDHNSFIPAGKTGVVVFADEQSNRILVEMDEKFDNLVHYENRISFYDIGDGSFEYRGWHVPPVLAFHFYCQWQTDGYGNILTV